jgi:hypothetical protein
MSRWQSAPAGAEFGSFKWEIESGWQIPSKCGGVSCLWDSLEASPPWVKSRAKSKKNVLKCPKISKGVQKSKIQKNLFNF